MNMREFFTVVCSFMAGMVWHRAPSSYLSDLWHSTPCSAAGVCTRCWNERAALNAAVQEMAR